jgi:hypothetical protein
MCGEVPCSSGCGDFSTASPDSCKPRILQTGGVSGNEVSAFMLPEGSGSQCSRGTRAYNVARAYGDALIIVAANSTGVREPLVAPVDSNRGIMNRELLGYERVYIPVGVLTPEDGATHACRRLQPRNCRDAA